MDDQQQPNQPEAGTPPNPDLAQKASDDKLSRNLLIAGLLIVAVALGVHLMSPKEPAAGKTAAANGAADGSPLQPKAAPSIRGKDAPAVTLKNLDGKQVSLADYKGKAVLVNFWATWCQPCLLEIPWFIQFQEKYGKDGFQVLAISLDEEGPKVVKPFVEKHNMKSFVVMMGEEKTPELFGGLLGLPTTFMVDRDGKLYSKHQGLVTKDDVEQEIQILVGAPVAQAVRPQAAQESLRN
jgi:thiol-disulfide isomerase/thioredoxin